MLSYKPFGKGVASDSHGPTYSCLADTDQSAAALPVPSGWHRLAGTECADMSGNTGSGATTCGRPDRRVGARLSSGPRVVGGPVIAPMHHRLDGMSIQRRPRDELRSCRP
jgi:hypothetical protein